MSDSNINIRMNEQDEKIMTLAEKLDLLIQLVSPQHKSTTSSSSSKHNKTNENSGHAQPLQTDDDTTDDITSLPDEDNENENKSDNHNDNHNENSNGSFTTPKTKKKVNNDSPGHSSPSIMSYPNPFNGDGNGNSKLPPLKEIPIGGITVDDYIEWRRKLLHNVSQVPKYNNILTDEPTESWKQFSDTYNNLPPNVLEKAYLDSHQVLSAYIHGAIPNAIEVMVQSKMK
jgi:hypothetical protein